MEHWHADLEPRALALPAVYHIRHIGGEDERHAVPLDAAKLLGIAKELSKINVEEVTALCQHHIVVVAIAHPCVAMMRESKDVLNRPRMYVATQYPAHDSIKLRCARSNAAEWGLAIFSLSYNDTQWAA